MDYELKKKDVLNSNYLVFSVGYCKIQFLLHYKSRIGYTASRTYGWRSDIYQVETGVAISTGYGPFGIPLPYELCKEYDTKAEKIVYASGKSHEDRKKEVEVLYNEFIDKAKQYAKENGFVKEIY